MIEEALRQKKFLVEVAAGSLIRQFLKGAILTYHSGCDTIFNEKVCILYTYLVEKSYGKCKDGESRLSEILQRIPGRIRERIRC